MDAFNSIYFEPVKKKLSAQSPQIVKLKHKNFKKINNTMNFPLIVEDKGMGLNLK